MKVCSVVFQWGFLFKHTLKSIFSQFHWYYSKEHKTCLWSSPDVRSHLSNDLLARCCLLPQERLLHDNVFGFMYQQLIYRSKSVAHPFHSKNNNLVFCWWLSIPLLLSLHKKYLIYHVIFYQKIELSFLPLWINAMFWIFHKVLKHSSCWCNREVRKQTYLQNWKWNHNLSQHITLLDPHHSLSLPIPPNHRKRTYISINVTNIFQAVSFKVLNWLKSGHVVTPKYMTYPWVRFKMSDINLLHTMVSCW